MKSRIEHGVTIITTGTKGNEVLNKTGYVGVTYYSSINKYRAEIIIKKHKYLLGFFNSLQEAINARMIAAAKKEKGLLEEWIKNKPHGNSPKLEAFWEEALKQYEMERGQ